MAKRSKIRISDFRPSGQDTITFDTNILIKLLYPAMNDANMRVYENLYAKVLQEKSKLIISSIQISEFINRCIRFQFQLYQKVQNDTTIEFKKDYRDTDDYRASMEAILDIINSDIIPNYL